MLLAAGRGERMRPLTDRTPKPLLEAGGQSLIERHIQKFAAAGFERIIVNHAHLGEQIVAAVGNGSRWGIAVSYSPEHKALETAGGIANALDLIDSDTFAVANCDVYSEYDYANLKTAAQRLADDPRNIAHLVLVDNPAHNPSGDFALDDTKVAPANTNKLTFSGLAAYHRAMFASVSVGQKQPLAPLLKAEALAGRVTGEHYHGAWTDVGTPGRLDALNEYLKQEQP
ncbi:MAG TPA: nucleotidyltransferase family protein [Burkholderiales bacterium]|nr:nucleotidyltransferase family protein [Burkholderiales bacterium]